MRCFVKFVTAVCVWLMCCVEKMWRVEPRTPWRWPIAVARGNSYLGLCGKDPTKRRPLLPSFAGGNVIKNGELVTWISDLIRGVATIFQMVARQIVTSFSPPIVGCLLERLPKGGLWAHQDHPPATPLLILTVHCLVSNREGLGTSL